MLFIAQLCRCGIAQCVRLPNRPWVNSDASTMRWNQSFRDELTAIQSAIGLLQGTRYTILQQK